MPAFRPITEFPKDIPILNTQLHAATEHVNELRNVRNRLERLEQDELEEHGNGPVLPSSPGLVCGPARRGQLNFIANVSGGKDILQVCAKDAADVYAWQVLY